MTSWSSSSDARDVEIILEDHPEIELLVFDIDLPERTGVECLRSLRLDGVETPCLLITGGVTDPPELDRIAFLRKPFKIDALLASARTLLGTCLPDAYHRRIELPIGSLEKRPRVEARDSGLD